MSTMDLRRKLSDSRSSSESSSDAVTQKSSLEIHSLGGATSPSLLPVSNSKDKKSCFLFVGRSTLELFVSFLFS
uniref:Uncharacterized protein n=1 Tax=Caenorhabditis tropicalis TaxID=1561998 RepID=A0A1I7UBZ6_9PELO